jgi:hypothetical protein
MNRFSVMRTAAIASAIVCTAAAAAPQAFVESTGSDANTRFGCPQVKPCRTFAAAMTVVDAGGEIVALDAADYGTFSVTKSVSVMGNSQASIVAASGDAVTIATPGVDVLLRGLSINGFGLPLANGIAMTKGSSLAIEKCLIANFGLHGVAVEAPAAVRIAESTLSGNSNGASIGEGATADVVKSRFTGNRGAGLLVLAKTAPTSASVSDSIASGNLAGFESASFDGTTPARMAVTRSTAANNSQFGFATSVAAVMSVGDSMASGNGVGFANVPSPTGMGTFESLGNNLVRQNTTPTLGIITPVAGM